MHSGKMSQVIFSAFRADREVPETSDTMADYIAFAVQCHPCTEGMRGLRISWEKRGKN